VIEELKPYPRMKDSGVPWLGQVPDHWTVPRARYLFRETDRRSESGKETHLSMSQKLGLVPSSMVEQQTLVSESYAGGKLCESNDLVLNRLKAHLGVFARATEPGVISPDYTVLRARRLLEVRFFEETLRSPACRVELRQRAKGIVEGFWRLYTDDLYDIRLPEPPVEEQRSIVRFIDHADRRTRRYIRAKQKLIKLLEEQKQAIIHRAVTRGLDPNACLKPSGLDWLGDMPQHWEIRRAGRLFAQRNEVGFADLPILEVSLRTGVRVRHFGRSERKQVLTDRDKYKRAVAGDVAYNMMRMWQGAVGVAPADGLVSPAYIVARPIPGTHSQYFENLFRLPAFMGEVDKYFARNSQGPKSPVLGRLQANPFLLSAIFRASRDF
jgi:type I restriction enzyme S subunit